MVLELIVTILEIFTDPIKEHVVTPLKNHISYAFTLDRKVERLHHEVEQLKNKRVRLHQSVDEASRNGEQIFPNVTEWLSSVEKDIEEVEKLVQGKEEAKNKCCSGFCPNLKTRYELSKKAHKKALVMEKQLQNAQRLDPIAFRPPPQPIVEPSMYTREALPSRVLILNHIMEALKDPNLNTIGVYGMGGVGKTTLAKEVLGQAIEQKLFETVVLVAVSQTPELRRIQGEIADALDLKFQAEQVPGRASRLHQRLNKAKVLIILDDVWQKLDLNAIGIPIVDASEGCKILLTSRRKEVLSIDMCTQKVFLLDVLEEEETWRLFEMSVSKSIDSGLHAIATQVSKKCAGLPLLVLKVARDLRNKDSYAWSDMLNRLSSLENTEIYEKVHKVIESSYEQLYDEEAKSLFLLCALFGNSNILLQDLLIYCLGLGLFKRSDSIEGARNRVLTLIDKLKNESLLLDGDKAGFVKIHDVVRDTALAIASRVQHAFVGTSKIRSTDLQNKDFTRISLPHCDICELPGVLECPEAEVFSLAGYLSLDIPDAFFERVAKLKVLHFSGVHLVSVLPSSLGFLTSLQTVYLQRCDLNNVAIIAELKQLEVLSFADSFIRELPSEIKALTRLKLLDLTNCYHLWVIPANVLSNLCLLEELYMLNSFDHWEEEGLASLVELKNLSHLTTLEIRVRDDKLLPDDWFFNGMRRYKISVGNMSLGWFEEYESSRMLQLELKTSTGLMHRIKEFLRGAEVLYLGEVKGIHNLSFDSGIESLNSLEKIHYSQLTDSFGKLQSLNISGCNALKNLFPFSCGKCLPQLQGIELKDCNNMEFIVGEGSEDEVMEFTPLTSLKLKYLPRLKGFCKTSETVCFPNLTTLEMYGCNSLKYVFTISMVKSLQQLKNLEIDKCEFIEEIIVGKKFEEIEESINTVIFPELDFLKLRMLVNLKRFSSGCQIEFPKVRELMIDSCHGLNNFVSKFSDRSNNNKSTDYKTLFNEMVTFSNLEVMSIGSMNKFRYLWHPQFRDDDSFSKLKSLKIDHCFKLSVVFPSNAYRRFQRLESLSLSDCDVVEEIYGYDIGVEETNILQPFSLQRIHIDRLPSLKHIFPKNINEAFSFRNLQSVEVYSCPVLKYVFPASIVCGLLQLQHLDIFSCGISVVLQSSPLQHVYIEEAFSFQNLESFKVRYCRDLKYVFPASIACRLLQLQHLQISHCGVEFVIAEAKNAGSEGNTACTFELLNLKNLDICGCDKLMDFGFGISKEKHKNQVIPKMEDLLLDHHSLKAIAQSDGFPVRLYEGSLGGQILLLDDEKVKQEYDHLTVKYLELQMVRNLKHILKKHSQQLMNPVLQYLQTLSVMKCCDLVNIAPSSASFQNLTTLKVENCQKMISLVTASTAKTMVHLVKLSVSECKMMEEIIVVNDGHCTEHEHDAIIFSKMRFLTLDELPNLNSFCSGNYNFNFPLLERVSIQKCKQMKIFCGGVLTTPKLQCQGSLNEVIAQLLNGSVYISEDEDSSVNFDRPGRAIC